MFDELNRKLNKLRSKIEAPINPRPEAVTDYTELEKGMSAIMASKMKHRQKLDAMYRLGVAVGDINKPMGTPEHQGGAYELVEEQSDLRVRKHIIRSSEVESKDGNK